MEENSSSLVKRACYGLSRLSGLVSVSLAWATEPIAVLSPSDVPPHWTNAFAERIAVGDDVIAVGAIGDPWYSGDDTGAVYVFCRSGPDWVEQDKLIDPEAPFLNLLGYSVAVEGDLIVAGAPHFETTFPPGGPGAVYVFRRDRNGTEEDFRDDRWVQEAKLSSPGPVRGDLLGFSVGISGDVVAAGNWYHDRVEVYRRLRGTWTHESTLTTPTAQSGMGWSVAIEGDVIIAGAPFFQTQTGVVQVFQREQGNWHWAQTLAAYDGGPKDDFGMAISMSGGNILVGANGYDTPPNLWEAGAGYLFSQNQDRSWALAQKLMAEHYVYGDGVGWTVAIDKDLILMTGQYYLYYQVQRFRQVKNGWIGDEDLDVDNINATGQRPLSLKGSFAAIGPEIYVVRNHYHLRSYQHLQNCITMGELAGDCVPFDLDGNGVLDLSDFERFTGTFAGP